MPVANDNPALYNKGDPGLPNQKSHSVQPNKPMNLSEIPSFAAHDAHGRLRVSEETYQRIYRPCVARLIEFFEDIPVTDITQSDLADWQGWLGSRGTAVATRNTYARTARALWNHLKSRGVPVCDVTGVFVFESTQKGVKSVSSANAWKMLAATGIRDAAILWLAMDSARRRGGLAGLTLDNCRVIWNDDLKEYYVVGEVIEKGNKPQILLAYHGAAMALNAWLVIREELLRVLKIEDHRYIFVDTRTGAPLAKQTMSALTTKIAQKANIPANEPTNLHSFRHAAAKRLLKDLNLAEVRDILGHSSVSTTADIYAVNGKEELMEAFFERTRRKR